MKHRRRCGPHLLNHPARPFHDWNIVDDLASEGRPPNDVPAFRPYIDAVPEACLSLASAGIVLEKQMITAAARAVRAGSRDHVPVAEIPIDGLGMLYRVDVENIKA